VVVVASMVAAAFTVVVVASMVAAGSTAVAAFAGEAAFAAMAAGASAEGTAVFVEASEATVEATGGMAEVGAGAGVEVGAGADSVGPTSDLAWVTIPGPIGPDRTLATTDTPIIPSTGATIPTDLIPAIRLATARTVATRIPTARM
jgi:hypothetical protein